MFGGVVALSLLHLLEWAVRELAVAVKAGHAKQNVAVSHIGMPPLDERLDQGDDRTDVLGCLGLVVGPAETQRIGVRDVGRRHLACELVARNAAFPGCFVDLVVHVGDVHHEVRVVALVLEKALEQREQHVGTGISDVNTSVDRGTAHVHPHPWGVAGIERAHPAAQRVVNTRLAHRDQGYEEWQSSRSDQKKRTSSS